VASGARFDVAVLDLHMPGLDGVELARALRAVPAGAQLPLVILSSLQSRLPAADLQLFTAELTKPARSSLLHEKLLQATDPAHAVLHAVETAGGRRQGDGRPIDVATQPLRVLLAEDNLMNQKVAQLMLAKYGHRVDTVSNGGWAQPVGASGGLRVELEAITSASAAAGVFQPRVLRGRVLSRSAIASRSAWEWTRRSPVLVRYWRSSPLDAPMCVKWFE